MSTPAFYGVAAPVGHVETLISHVFLAGNRAYKLKKKLVLPFVDYGTLARRRFYCNEEIRLNQPLAPRVYLGVRAVVETPDGLALADPSQEGALEYVVEMRRFSESETLLSHVSTGSADAALMRRVGAAAAAFHAGAPRVRDAETFRDRIGEDLDQLRLVAAGAADATELKTVVAAARAFIERTNGELDGRSRDGLVREGHGDLRLEHVLVGERIEFVDRVEFDPALRTGDVAYDLAFAVMELHDRGAGALADELVAGYRAAGGDGGDHRLLCGLAACRALVRAKVAALRRPARPGELDRLLALARRLFWPARCPLTVVVCGPAATGKTALAGALARRSGLPHLSSDLVRKARAGAAPTERLTPSGYTDAASFAVYDELGRRAREQARAGHGSVVDATCRRASDRHAFDEAFGDVPGGFVVLRLAVPPAVANARARDRSADPHRVSDAGPEQAALQAQRFDPLDGRWLAAATQLDAERPVPELTFDAEAAVDLQLRASSRDAAGSDIPPRWRRRRCSDRMR